MISGRLDAHLSVSVRLYGIKHVDDSEAKAILYEEYDRSLQLWCSTFTRLRTPLVGGTRGAWYSHNRRRVRTGVYSARLDAKAMLACIKLLGLLGASALGLAHYEVFVQARRGATRQWRGSCWHQRGYIVCRYSTTSHDDTYVICVCRGGATVHTVPQRLGVDHANVRVAASSWSRCRTFPVARPNSPLFAYAITRTTVLGPSVGTWRATCSRYMDAQTGTKTSRTMAASSKRASGMVPLPQAYLSMLRSKSCGAVTALVSDADAPHARRRQHMFIRDRPHSVR